jgi:multidrug efflux system membrane fusion protein
MENKSHSEKKIPEKKIKESRMSLQRIFMSGFHKTQTHPTYRSLEAKYGRKNLNRLILFFGLLAVLLILWACNSSESDKHKKKPPIPVLVSQVRKSDVPVYLNTIGTVLPIDSLIVKTQINGRITDVHFQEGQLVQKGDLLVQIDPQPYEAVLAQATGQLIKDQALLKNAQLDLKRYQRLHREDSVSRQTLDTQASLVKQLEGTVQSDQGLVDSATVNLKYCKIVSDITGVVGLRQINSGNFVQTSDTTPITTVNTISPIAVIFPIPEDDLGNVQKNFRKDILAVEAFDRKQDKILDTGTLTAIDSQIDNTTGTIKLKATFKNEHYNLYPNQFVNIRLKVETLPNVLVIPTAALQIGREGPFVYILNEENSSVSVKFVTVKTSLAEDSVISGDLSEGQVVVIQGQDKLTEGATVLPTQVENQHPNTSAVRPPA